MSIRWKILACLWLAAGNAVAQDALPYQMPPAEILQLADVQRPPSVVADSGKTRLVLLPKESHGYAAKESILHLLWEQDQWLERYVKHKGQGGGSAPAVADR